MSSFFKYLLSLLAMFSMGVSPFFVSTELSVASSLISISFGAVLTLSPVFSEEGLRFDIKLTENESKDIRLFYFFVRNIGHLVSQVQGRNIKFLLSTFGLIAVVPYIWILVFEYTVRKAIYFFDWLFIGKGKWKLR